MKSALKSVLSVACALTLQAPFSGHAQQALAPVPDTTGYRPNGFGRPPFVYYQGDLMLADGSALRAYLPTSPSGFAKTVDAFLTAPAVNSRAVRKTYKIADVHALHVHQQYYEAMQVGLKEPSVLALRVADGTVELFLYSEPKPVPVVGALGPAGQIAGMLVTYANNHWYVRREGQLTEVSRGFFATQMSEYLDDFPDVAQKIALGAKDYGYQDMRAIITEFNAHKAVVTRKEKP